MEYGGKCSLCGEGGHRASRCPDLCDPLREGFFKGGGRGGGGDCDDHDHDDRVKLEQMVGAGVPVVLRRTWNTHTEGITLVQLQSRGDSISQLKLQFSPHVASYAARRHSAILCRI